MLEGNKQRANHVYSAPAGDVVVNLNKVSLAPRLRRSSLGGGGGGSGGGVGGGKKQIQVTPTRATRKSVVSPLSTVTHYVRDRRLVFSTKRRY